VKNWGTKRRKKRKSETLRERYKGSGIRLRRGKMNDLTNVVSFGGGRKTAFREQPRFSYHFNLSPGKSIVSEELRHALKKSPSLTWAGLGWLVG